MTLAEKIKRQRKARGMTQAELCGDRITRNMLSCIENSTATPSLDTLLFIADRLEIPAGYLLSDNFDTDFYGNKLLTDEARELYRRGDYKGCIDKLSTLDNKGDEVSYLLAHSYYQLGLKYFGGGSMRSAHNALKSAIEYSALTLYDTERITASSQLYLAVCENVTLPLLEFDEKNYVETANIYADLQFYKYLIADSDFSFNNEQYKMHLEARRLIKERKLSEAVPLLTRIEDTKRDFPPNAYLMFCVYSDLEVCYKNLFDFERAYKYSAKRISLLEGFSS